MIRKTEKYMHAACKGGWFFGHRRSLRRVVVMAFPILCCSGLFAAQTFTLAVIGDQQVPVNEVTYLPSFTAQTDWLAANAQASNIRLVLQVGDIVETGSNRVQWARAAAAMETLDTAINADGGTGMTWSVAYGNHEQDDTQTGTDPAGAWAHLYRETFGSASGTHRYAGQPTFGGVSSNDLNTYHIIRASNAPGARMFLVLTLEYDVPGHAPGSTPDPGDVPAFDAIAWAQSIIDQHPGMPTIISTHVFEGWAYGPPSNPYTSGPGRNSQLQIFDKLIKDNAQIFLVLSGHTSQETYQVKQNAAGLDVLQIVTDYNKWISNGGDGYMRLIELDEDLGELRVKTYTPGIPSYIPPTPPGYRTDADAQFTIAMDWLNRFGAASTGPFMGTPTVTTTGDDGATVQSQIVNAGATGATLVWAETNQGTGNVTNWSASPGGGLFNFGPATNGSVLSRGITNLAGDTQYRFRFQVTDSISTNWSGAGTFATGLRGEAAPADLAATAASGVRVDLTWTDGYATETGFVIQRATDPGFVTTAVFNVSADETGYADNSVEPSSMYYYRIAAEGSTGLGPFSDSVSLITGEAWGGIYASESVAPNTTNVATLAAIPGQNTNVVYSLIDGPTGYDDKDKFGIYGDLLALNDVSHSTGKLGSNYWVTVQAAGQPDGDTSSAFVKVTVGSTTPAGMVIISK